MQKYASKRIFWWKKLLLNPTTEIWKTPEVSHNKCLRNGIYTWITLWNLLLFRKALALPPILVSEAWNSAERLHWHQAGVVCPRKTAQIWLRFWRKKTNANNCLCSAAKLSQNVFHWACSVADWWGLVRTLHAIGLTSCWKPLWGQTQGINFFFFFFFPLSCHSDCSKN